MSAFLITCAAQVSAGQDKISFQVLEIQPYGYLSEEGNYKGYVYDFARAAFKDAGFDPAEITTSPLKRLMRDLDNQALDCTILAKTSYVRERFRLVLDLNLMLETAIVAKKGIDLNSYDDLKSLRIASAIGVKIFDRFDNDDSLNKVASNNYRNNVIMMQRGRADAMAGVYGSLLFSMRELDLNPDEELGKPLIFERVPLMLVCRTGKIKKELLNRFTKSVKKLRDQGLLQTIATRYIGNRQESF